MEDEMKLVAIGIFCVALILVSGIGGCTVFNINEQNKIAEMVRNGAHPIDARCAFYNSYADAVCANRSVK